MEKTMCSIIDATANRYQHEVLSLDNNIEAMTWLRTKPLNHIEFHKPAGRVQFFRALYKALKKTTPDLMMTYNWGATDAIWLGRLLGSKNIIHNEHGFNVDEARGTSWRKVIIRSLVYRMASRVIVVSRNLETMMWNRYRVNQERVVHIPNGIDVAHYSPDGADRLRIRRALGFENNAFVVGFSGRLDAVKNLTLLLEVFERFFQEKPDARMLIVGDGPERKRVERLCSQGNIKGRIVLTGAQKNVLPYLRAMDVFLLPSFSEQMPLTILEAMAVGIPVVATKVGEIPYIIDHKVNGFVLDLRAPLEAFVDLLRVLFCPPHRGAIGAAARQKIVAHFQAQSMAQRYATVFQQLL
jgi:glycosyltransferase involved in cell wall biosynthesis